MGMLVPSLQSLLTLIYAPLQEKGVSPLLIASQCGQSEIVDVLVKNGADVNQPDNVELNL